MDPKLLASGFQREATDILSEVDHTQEVLLVRMLVDLVDQDPLEELEVGLHTLVPLSEVDLILVDTVDPLAVHLEDREVVDLVDQVMEVELKDVPLQHADRMERQEVGLLLEADMEGQDMAHLAVDLADQEADMVQVRDTTFTLYRNSKSIIHLNNRKRLDHEVYRRNRI